MGEMERGVMKREKNTENHINSKKITENQNHVVLYDISTSTHFNKASSISGGPSITQGRATGRLFGAAAGPLKKVFPNTVTPSDFSSFTC